MTTQRSFKQRVRTRMSRTGESCTAARRMLIAAGDRPEAVASDWQPTISDEAIVRATGRPWSEWLALVDGWDGWLPGAVMGRRTATRPRTARYDWQERLLPAGRLLRCARSREEPRRHPA